MTDLLNTGKSAIFAFQQALATTSHNIANVNTEGYSRQRVNFESKTGDARAGYFIGSGVNVADIQRIHDEFSTRRVQSATSAHTAQQTHYEMGTRIDGLIATDGISITPAMNDLFNSIQDANNDASSLALREVSIDRSEQLAYQFRTLQGQLDDTQVEVNERMRIAADRVSQIAQSIADINIQVSNMQGLSQAQATNDLFDKRDQLVMDLSRYVEVDTLVQSNGAMNVYVGKGFGIVTDRDAKRIQTAPDEFDTGKLQFTIGEPGQGMRLDSLLAGGEIGGLADFVNEALTPAKQELGRIALIMADQFNLQLSRGIDLNGDAGEPLFQATPPRAFSANRNTGSGVISATVSDASALEAADYEVRFDGANYHVTRTSDGEQSTGALPLTVDGIDITITGTPSAGDRFIFSATSHAAESMRTLISDPKKLALAGQLSTSSNISNPGDSQISSPEIIDPDNTSLRDPIRIEFTSDTTYDIIDVTSGSAVVSGAPYNDGDPVTLNGWRVNISGGARTGDTHNITFNNNGSGSNSNGLLLAGLQLTPTIDGTQSFNDAYASMVSRVGANTNTAKSSATALEALKDNALDRQQSVQGVSLDEEAIDLTRYQQAYQASAQIISTADKLFQTILGAIR